ncbi:MAG: DUF4296 domain-containing protein [Lewinellaceae bacterium]|nr:DUF4296 domain-containing protein [Lewinellaceae bacterium]
MRRLGFFLLLLGVLGCQQVQEPLPIAERDLVPILLDIHVAEDALQSVFGPRRDSLRAVYFQEIYRIHRTDSVALANTMLRLREDPERLERVYQRVIDLLEDVQEE